MAGATYLVPSAPGWYWESWDYTTSVSKNGGTEKRPKPSHKVARLFRIGEEEEKPTRR